jgi:hypothetical protein
MPPRPKPNPLLFARIHTLLQDGATLKRVGEIVGLSISRVWQIREELRHGRQERRSEASATGKVMVGGVMPTGWAEIMSRAERCGGCGGKVVMPCRLCRVRGEAEKQRRTDS